jgi:hypothetical protein
MDCAGLIAGWLKVTDDLEWFISTWSRGNCSGHCFASLVIASPHCSLLRRSQL